MTSSQTAARPLRTVLIGAICIALGLAGGWLLQGQRDKAAVEKIVHDYLLEHPEILPKAMEALQKKENASQLSGIRKEVEKAWPGQVLGNPDGKVTLVEFTDFACTYCRHSVEDVEALVAQDKDLKVVVKQLPILSPESADAAKMGMAAAEQGRYAAFHKAMFAAGRPDPQTIEAAARASGVDLVRARRVMADPRFEAELARNIELARQLGFSGTPAWVVGDALISGAVGKDKLAEAIADARS